MNVPKWLAAVVVLVVVCGVGGTVYGVRSAGSWERKAGEWEATAAGRDTLRAQDQVVIDNLGNTLDSTTATLNAALTYSARMAAEAARLRRERDNLVLTPSVPGLPPSVGDTLRFCRSSLSLCAQEANWSKARADSLERVARFTVEQVSSLRESAEYWKDTWERDRNLFRLADNIIADAEPPCYWFRLGPARVKCPDRTSTAFMAAGGTLAVFGKTREQRAAGYVLVTIGIVW